MPRIIVTTNPVSSEPTEETPVLLDEHVHSVHLSTKHAAAQLVERLAWAVRDAESAETTPGSEQRARQDRPTHERRPSSRGRARGPVAA